MKPIAAALIALFALGALACSKTAAPPAPSSAPAPPVLEITSDFRGLFWMTGTVLDFRLADDGTAEYDEYPLAAGDDGPLEAARVKTTKRVKIGADELARIRALLAAPELAAAPAEFRPRASCTDAFIDTRIELAAPGAAPRRIAVEGHCLSLAATERTAYYFDRFPLALNELFQIINKVRARESAGRFY